MQLQNITALDYNTAMRCAKCNHHIPSNSRTCPHCGELIRQENVPDEVSPSDLDAPIHWSIQDTFAIVGFAICFISGGLFSPVGIVFSLLSLREKQKHRWISFWGLGMNVFFIVAWIAGLIVLINIPK